MSNERYTEIENYEKEFWKLIEQSFNIKLEGMDTSASSIVNGPIAFNARFPTKNQLLKETPYLYSETNKLLHFTSLQSLFSIINEGSLRLYNLHNSNDTDEYLYASKKLEDIYYLQGTKEGQLAGYINRIKEFSFILSCTSIDGLDKPDFWKKYGDCGKGVAIEFEIINSVNDWEYFYCSKIQYDKLNDFDILKQNWERLQNKIKNNVYQIGLNQFLSLHKSKDWINEKEIRILTLFPDLHTEPFKNRIYKEFKPKHFEKEIKYFKLPLCDKTGKFIEKNLETRVEKFWSIIPRLRINDIYFGPNSPLKSNLWRFQEKLKYYIAEKMDCWIKELPRINTFGN